MRLSEVRTMTGVIFAAAPEDQRLVASQVIIGLAKRMPWEPLTNDGWAIVGMNHYHLKGTRHLFVAMTKAGRCITAEGSDEAAVFDHLAELASEAAP